MRNGKPVDLDKIKDLVEVGDLICLVYELICPLKVVINGDIAEIIFKNPQKNDTGKWELRLENTGGVSGGKCKSTNMVRTNPSPCKPNLVITN